MFTILRCAGIPAFLSLGVFILFPFGTAFAGPYGSPDMYVIDSIYRADTCVYIPPTTRVIFVAPENSSEWDIDQTYPIDDGFPADTGAGDTFSRPVTLARAKALLQGGFTVVFRGGTYRHWHDIYVSCDSLTFQPFRDEKVWINGSTCPAEWQQETVNGKVVWSLDWSDSLQYYRGVVDSLDSTFLLWNIDPAFPLAAYPDQLFINDTALTQVDSVSTIGQNEFCIPVVIEWDSVEASFDGAIGWRWCPVTYEYDTIEKLYIDTCWHPNSQKVEAVTYQWAFVIDESVDTITLRGLGFTHYAVRPLLSKAERTRIENCVFSWNSSSGFGIHAFDGLEESTKAVLKGNLVACNGAGGGGFNSVRGDSSLIENCTFLHNNVARFNTHWGAAGSKTLFSHNLLWRQNVFHHNYGTGLWFDGNCKNIGMYRNRANDNLGHGLFFEVGNDSSSSYECDATIAYNLCYRNRNAGISVALSPHTYVLNNTCVNNQYGIRAYDTDYRIDDGGRAQCDSNVILNNLCVVFDDTIEIANDALPTDERIITPNLLVGAGGFSDTRPSSGKLDEFNTNVYFTADTFKNVTYLRWIKEDSTAINYDSLSYFLDSSGTQFEAESRQYKVSGDSISIGRNRDLHDLFVDSGSDDYRLKPHSSLLYRGTDISSYLNYGGQNSSENHIGAFDSVAGEEYSLPVVPLVRADDTLDGCTRDVSDIVTISVEIESVDPEHSGTSVDLYLLGINPQGELKSMPETSQPFVDSIVPFYQNFTLGVTGEQDVYWLSQAGAGEYGFVFVVDVEKNGPFTGENYANRVEVFLEN